MKSLRFPMCCLRWLFSAIVLGTMFVGCASPPQPTPVLPHGTVRLALADGIVCQTADFKDAKKAVSFHLTGNTAHAEESCRIILPNSFVLGEWLEDVPVTRQDDRYVAHAIVMLKLNPIMALASPRIDWSGSFTVLDAEMYIRDGRWRLPVETPGYSGGWIELQPSRDGPTRK